MNTIGITWDSVQEGDLLCSKSVPIDYWLVLDKDESREGWITLLYIINLVKQVYRGREVKDWTDIVIVLDARPDCANISSSEVPNG